MFVKVVMILFILAIIGALLAGGYFVVKDPGTKRRALHALSWRVGLQAALILFLVLAFFMGWIQPHPVGG